MHLKSLRIQGFKTFARRTELPFSRGITAIVGPNGSGKSNLVDAIRWGLGERNARGLRGQKMEDVIYSGGPGKSAVGMAEVSLTIDNADQRLNVEFTEVEVARRLFRSGESDYLINGTRARLKDIDLLLSSTGLRQDGYAVTAQNDIDYVIQAAPSLRRELIEEAAGVRRLRDQRQEALNRLAEAERDMARARDILAELAPRAAELTAQAEAAEEYQRIAVQLKQLQGSLAKDAWRKAMAQLRRARGRLGSAEQKRSSARQALLEFEPGYAQRRTALLEAREARWQHQEAINGVRLQLAESQHQARIAEERLAAARRALQAAEHEMERLHASAKAGSRVVEELAQSAERTSHEYLALQSQAASAGAEEQAERERLEALQARAIGLNEERLELHRQGVAAEAESRQVEGRLQFLNEQRQRAELELEAWTERRRAIEEEFERCNRQVQETSSASRLALDRLAAADEELRLASEEVSRSEELISRSGRALAAREAELHALCLLRDAAVRESKLADDPDFRQLLELIEVAPEHRVAVEAALEGWLHAWVPRDDEAAGRAVELLAGEGAIRETVITGARSASQPELDGELAMADLISAPPELEETLRQLLAGCVLIGDPDHARRLLTSRPELRVVTPKGELLTAASYRSGSFADASLEVQARVRAAQDGVEAARLDQVAAMEAHATLTQRRQALLQSRAELVDAADSARAAEGRAAAALSLTAAALQREDEGESKLRSQSTRIAALLNEARQSQGALSQRRESIERSQAELTAALAELEEQIREASFRVSRALGSRQDSELRAALAEQRHEDLSRQLARAQEVWRTHGDELAQREAAARELSTQPALLEEERNGCLARAAALDAQLAGLESANLPDGDLLAGLEAQVQEGEQRNVQLQVEIAHTEDAVATAQIEAEVAEAEVERCALALREDGQALEEEEGLPEVDWQKTEREVSRLQRRLDGMGAVNLLAPEELSQVRERCDSLGGQLADLESATTQLLELKERLENEIDERFRTVFHSVAINFQEFFGELFEGGKATLRMEAGEADSRLDEGVEILAQTPGKRLQPLTLLSGGERALTALAFLFALQAVNPSPFYVLDEVDAALDDANVIRFNRVLKRLSRDQQFLIVTHNHSTMAQAEVLYGVTLGEHGISRIVSVRLEQDALMPVGERTA